MKAQFCFTCFTTCFSCRPRRYLCFTVSPPSHMCAYMGLFQKRESRMRDIRCNGETQVTTRVCRRNTRETGETGMDGYIRLHRARPSPIPSVIKKEGKE